MAKKKIKKIVTSTRNTASTNSQKSKGGSNQKAKGTETTGAVTTAAVAPAIPGAFEGLWALLSALGGALAGTVGRAFSSVILPVVLVAAVAALGIGAYKYLSEEKATLTPTIAEQILEMARKKKEEQETIKTEVGDGTDVVNPEQDGEIINPEELPDIEYPGNDPTVSPGEDWEWRGPADKGSWYNPKTGETLHPDLEHPAPEGPHWDYIPRKNGPQYRVFPDNTIVPKKL